MMYKAIIKNTKTGEIVFQSRKTAFRLDAELKTMKYLAHVKDKSVLTIEIIESNH